MLFGRVSTVQKFYEDYVLHIYQNSNKNTFSENFKSFGLDFKKQGSQSPTK